MRPLNGHANATAMGNLPISSTAKLDEMIPILAASDQVLPVVDEQDQLVGCVDRQAIMWALSANGSQPGWQGLPA
jgi:predicted transcriptional regulator